MWEWLLFGAIGLGGLGGLGGAYAVYRHFRPPRPKFDPPKRVPRGRKIS